MNIRLLFLVLIGAYLNNVKGSEQNEKRQKGGRLKKLTQLSLGLLSLNYASSSSKKLSLEDELLLEHEGRFYGTRSQETITPVSRHVGTILTQKAPLNDLDSVKKLFYFCPRTLPDNALDMMNYIRCGNADCQASEFFDKYMIETSDAKTKWSWNIFGVEFTYYAKYDDDSVFDILMKILTEPPVRSTHKRNSCTILENLYQKAQKVGKCPQNVLTKICKGAKSLIVGKKLSHEKHREMFEEFMEKEYLNDFDKTKQREWAKRIYKNFSENEKLDFFQVRTAINALYLPQIDFYRSEIDAAEEALDPSLNFQRIKRMLRYAKNQPSHLQEEIHTESFKKKYQSYDFDKVDAAFKFLKSAATNTPDSDLYAYGNGLFFNALSEKYQEYDFKHIEDISDRLNKLFYPDDPFVSQEMLQPENQLWIQLETPDSITEDLMQEIKNTPSCFIFCNPPTIYRSWNRMKKNKIQSLKMKKILNLLYALFSHDEEFVFKEMQSPWIQYMSHENAMKIARIINDSPKKDLNWKKYIWISKTRPNEHHYENKNYNPRSVYDV